METAFSLQGAGSGTTFYVLGVGFEIPYVLGVDSLGTFDAQAVGLGFY